MNTLEKLEMDILNFNEAKKQLWEEKRFPYSAHFELTSNCNFNCLHCYLHDHHWEDEMPYSKVISIIDILWEKGILFLILTGGEIFTRKDFKDIYMYAKKKGFIIELFTNGMLITDDIIDMLSKYPPLLVEISLYGSCEETYKKVTGVSGAFQRVLKNCQKLVNANIRLSLKSPIIIPTLAEIETMQAIAEHLGVTFSPTFEICASVDGNDIASQYQVSYHQILQKEFKDYYTNNKNNEKINKTNDLLRQKAFERREYLFNCKIGKTSFVIDYTGKMCPCMKARHRGITLTATNFDDIWKDFEKYQHMQVSNTSKCKNCAALYYCEICPVEMELLYGDLEYKPEIYCRYAKARYTFYENGHSEQKAISVLD